MKTFGIVRQSIIARIFVAAIVVAILLPTLPARAVTDMQDLNCTGLPFSHGWGVSEKTASFGSILTTNEFGGSCYFVALQGYVRTTSNVYHQWGYGSALWTGNYPPQVDYGYSGSDVAEVSGTHNLCLTSAGTGCNGFENTTIY